MSSSAPCQPYNPDFVHVPGRDLHFRIFEAFVLEIGILETSHVEASFDRTEGSGNSLAFFQGEFFIGRLSKFEAS